LRYAGVSGTSKVLWKDYVSIFYSAIAGTEVVMVVLIVILATMRSNLSRVFCASILRKEYKMASNHIMINHSEVYEIPDSWMPPLMAYLKLVKTKLEYERGLAEQLEALEMPPPVGEEDRRKEVPEAGPEVT